MLTERAWALLAAGGLLWAASRIVGSADLHILGVGILALVPLAMAAIGLRRHATPLGGAEANDRLARRRSGRDSYRISRLGHPEPQNKPSGLVL